MKRPSFQFYPGDWTSSPNLKRCTFAERGIWLEVMCLMHDQEPYGVLLWPLKEIAQAAGCKVSDLEALARKGVLKGHDETLAEPFIYTPRSGRKNGPPVTLIEPQAGPIWYSSRMVKDEHVRQQRGDGADNGDAPNKPPKKAPKVPIGEAFGPRGSSSSSSPSEINTASSPPLNGEGSGGSGDLGQGQEARFDPGDVQPTTAGLLCRALRQAGIPDTNPGNLRLLTLLAAGATEAEFLALVRPAIDGTKSSPFAYLLGAVEGERKRAARTSQELHHGAMPAGGSGDRKARQLATAAVLTGASPAPKPPPETIDVHARIVAP